MYRIILIVICSKLIWVANVGFGQEIIFLHHSTGWGVYSEGGVVNWFNDYNSVHNTNYIINERSYPNTPYPWENYPYDYWNLWINGNCNDTIPNIACLDSLCSKYNVIIYKHCYPGADIQADDPESNISSPKMTLANYKLQYRALRDLMDSYPDNKFILWTLAPLHRLATSVENAARAHEFVNWVKYTWLKEDARKHSNIYIFDFYGYVSESDSNPVYGKLNCLKYEFETSHSSDNSHPNETANKYVGPLFAQFIIDALEDPVLILADSIIVAGKDGVDSIDFKGDSLQMIASVLPVNVTDSTVYWSVENITGMAIISGNGLLTAVSDGIVEVTAQSNDGSGVYGSCIITITNQSDTAVNKIQENLITKSVIKDGKIIVGLNNSEISNCRYKIYSLQGNCLLLGEVLNNEIPITNVPAGIYILTIQNDKYRIGCKLMVR